MHFLKKALCIDVNPLNYSCTVSGTFDKMFKKVGMCLKKTKLYVLTE